MDLTTYLLTYALLCLAPGPLIAILIVRSMAGQLRASAAFTAGIILADLMILAAVTAGLGLWVGSSEWFQAVGKAVGVAYLGWVALTLWRSSSGAPMAAVTSAHGTLREIAAGAAIALSSPYTFVLVASVLPAVGGTPEAVLAVLPTLLVGTLFVSGTIHGGFIVLAARLHRLLSNPLHRRRIDRTLSGLLAAATLWLALG